MISKNSLELLKLTNSKSCIYENLDNRNQKRFSQFSKRKKALSPDINIIKRNDISHKNKKKKNSNDIINIFNLIINKYNDDSDINVKKYQKNTNKDIGEKQKINKSIELIDNINDIKDINIIKSNNSLKSLSSSNSNKSFIKLGNNLKAKIKLQNNEFTESYILALGLNEQNYKRYKYQNLENINIIKEEKENNEDISEKGLKKAKSLSKFRFNKVKKKKINLFLDKNIKINNDINKSSFLLNTVNKFYLKKNIKQKIIKLKIDNYDQNFAIINIERRNINKDSKK